MAALRVYKDGLPALPPGSRLLVVEVPTGTGSALEQDAIGGGEPLAHYQLVGLSCLGNLEGTY